MLIHTGNQKKVDDPADEQQPQGKKINRAADGLAVIKPVGPHETEYPQYITDHFAVCIFL
jgi:hypothetical protein